jgi:hypothetical protein
MRRHGACAHALILRYLPARYLVRDFVPHPRGQRINADQAFELAVEVALNSDAALLHLGRADAIR